MSIERPPAPRSGRVALLGWTNVGKSTLLNRLVGTKLAAVADVSQTTRSRITGVRTEPERGQIIFLDTPGLHKPRHAMNRAMVQIARRTASGVDVVLFVIDAERGIGAGDDETAAWLGESGVSRIAVLNKIDRVKPKSRLLPMMERATGEWGCRTAMPVSARNGEGCTELIDELFAALPQAEPPFPDDMLTDQPERVLAAEWIREKLLAETRQELPHATAVVVERWNEREDGLLEIEATVLVERDSQRGIVIGKGGELLKRVGTAARMELEEFHERRIHLRLWVRVAKDWRNNTRVLREMGLG